MSLPLGDAGKYIRGGPHSEPENEVPPATFLVARLTVATQVTYVSAGETELQHRE